RSAPSPSRRRPSRGRPNTEATSRHTVRGAVPPEGTGRGGPAAVAAGYPRRVRTSVEHPPAAGTDDLTRLREDLQAAGYTVDHVEELLGPVAAGALHREQLLPARQVLADVDAPAAVLTRCWVLGEAVPEEQLAAALPGTGTEGLARAGLAAPAPEAGPEHWQATCELRPYGDESHRWWLASDFGEAVLRGPLPTDHVLGVGG